MSMEEKNKWLINYVNLLSKQINEQYGNIVHEEHIDRVISMYKDSDKEIETIKDEIDKIAKEFIENYLKRMQEIREEMLRKQMDEQQKMLEQLRKLNPNVQIDIQNNIKDEELESKLISSVPKEQLNIPNNIMIDENSNIIINDKVDNLDNTFIATFPTQNNNSKEDLIDLYVKKYNEIKNTNINQEQFLNWMKQTNPNLTENERLSLIYAELKSNFSNAEKDKVFNYFKKMDTNIKSEDDLTVFVQNTKLKVDMLSNPEEQLKQYGKLIPIPANKEQGFNYPFMIYIPNTIDLTNTNNLILHSCNTPEAMLDYSKIEEYTKIKQIKIDSLQMEMAIKGNTPLIMPIIPRFRGYNPEYVEDGLQRGSIENFMYLQNELNTKYQMTKEQIINEFNKSQDIIKQQMKMCDYAISYLRNMSIPMDNKIIVEGHSAGSKNAASIINQYPDRIVSYVIGGTTGIAQVNDNSIPGIVYNGALDKNNPTEFYYDEKGIARSKNMGAYTDEYIQNVVVPRYKKSLEEWKRENPNRDIKEFNVVQHDIKRQHKTIGDKGLLVQEYGHNAIDSPIVRQKAVEVVKNTKIKNNTKQENKTQQQTKNKESKPIPKQPSIPPKRQEEKQVKKSQPVKMNNFEKKAYPPLKQKQNIKVQAKNQVQNKSNVKTLKNTYKGTSSKSGFGTSGNVSKGFVNIILGSIIAIVLGIILFIIIK